MIIQKNKNFKKAFKNRIKDNSKLVKKAKERVSLFVENPKNPILKDHQLTGDKKEFRAFWITGDIRIIYFPISKDKVLFIDIGSHNQVY